MATETGEIDAGVLLEDLPELIVLRTADGDAFPGT